MLPNCVISTFGPRHIKGKPLPAASRVNSGSQPRLESPDQEAQVPLTTRGCWGGTGQAGVLRGTHLVQHCLMPSSLGGWQSKDHLEHFVYPAANANHEIRVLRHDSDREKNRSSVSQKQSVLPRSCMQIYSKLS